MDENRRNDDALFDALKKSKKKKRRRRLITVLVVVAAVAAGLLYAVNVLQKRVEASLAVEGDEVLQYEANYGSISTRVSGSGTIEDVDTETVTVPEGVEIEKVKVRTGEVLKKGDVIATLDLATVLNRMASVQSEIDEQDKQLAEAGNDRVNAQVSAGVSGRVKKVYITPNMDVANCMVENGALVLISLDGKMAVTIDDSSLAPGEAVNVERADGSLIPGAVEKNVSGAATILVTDNGPELDEQVRVLDAENRELGTGTLSIHSLFRVTGFTGTVAGISVQENQQVYAASTICSLTDTAYSARYNSILKQRQEKEKTLLELLDLYQGGALRAPFDGTVLKIDYDEDGNETPASAGASMTLNASNASSMYSMYTGMTGTGTVAADPASGNSEEKKDGISVITMSPDQSMLVKLSVDEADILSLEKGQIAEVTIESVSPEPLGGIVTEVDRTANSSSGVTSYTAEITFLKGKGMLSGMSADVVINIQGTENVLIVPTDAIHRTSAAAFVYTEYDSELKRFGGIVTVETGISNDEYTEIRSGLDAGVTVYYTEKKEDDFFMMMGGSGSNGSRRQSGGNRG